MPAYSQAHLLQLQCYHAIGMPLGYVLVGGKSTRMRRDKALLPWYHRRLFEHLVGLLRPHCGDVALLGADRPEFQGYRVIADAFPEMGPLAGILSALREPGEDWRLLLSCDTPLVDDAPIRELVAAARDAIGTNVGNVDIVLPQSPDGRLQPLCALWHRRVGVLLENHLGRIAVNPQSPRSQLAVQRFAHSLNLLPFHFHNVESVRNINTMRDYLAALAQRRSPE
ncbi:MAG: molybdenum cofactor guanylyltransferase [Bryobacterales bacterium]|nr:molybdenum cofactor guanylyltransferase [Bryobacterales bacterium]